MTRDRASVLRLLAPAPVPETPEQHLRNAVQLLILADERVGALTIPPDPELTDLIRAAEARSFGALFALQCRYRTPDLVAYAKGEAGLTTKSDVQLGLVLAHLFTGWNPCEEANDILSPVTLNPISAIPGQLGARIAALLKRMLVMNPAQREEAYALMDGWAGVFEAAVEMAHRLEGRAF